MMIHPDSAFNQDAMARDIYEYLRDNGIDPADPPNYENAEKAAKLYVALTNGDNPSDPLYDDVAELVADYLQVIHGYES